MKRNKRNKKFSLAIAAILSSLTFSLSGCVGGDSALRPDPNMSLNMSTANAILTSGQIGKPWLTMSLPTTLMYRNLFSATAGELDVEKDLVESFEISEDNRTYTINLKQDVVWSDGEILDAEDVGFSIGSLLILSKTQTVGTMFLTAFADIVGASDFMEDSSNGLKGMEVDGHTITLTLNNPNNTFLQVLSQFAIFPEHAMSEYGSENLFSTDLAYWDNPVCSGMYKLGEHTVDEQITLVYNDKYNGGDAPYINSIVLRSDFEYEELDYSETNDVSVILDYRSVSNQTEFDANAVFYRYFVFNIEKDGELDPVLSDVRVRRALTMAIDRDALVKNVYYGIGFVNDTASVQEYDMASDLKHEYNPEKARALLEEANYDFDRPIHLGYYYTDDISIRFMEECAKYLEAIGLTVEMSRGNLFSTDAYDMGLKGFTVFSVADWYSEYLSSSILHTNIYGGEPYFDDLVTQLNMATSEEERIETLIELQELEYDLLYKFPVFVMGHKVYISDNVILPAEVEFGDSKYSYDLDLENWKIKLD